MGTINKAKSFNDDELNQKLYQQRARECLPYLIAYAKQGMTVSYLTLAQQLNMSNPRNLNYVLGSINSTLQKTEPFKHMGIPRIELIAVGKGSGEPGSGVGEVEDMAEEQNKAYLYDKWDEVLSLLGLNNSIQNLVELHSEAGLGHGCGGEGIEHKKLKEYVKNNPEFFGMSGPDIYAEVEYSLPSGDSIDVYFNDDLNKIQIAIEVKSAISNTADVLRGLYQCVKYKKILQVREEVKQYLDSEYEEYESISILVLGKKMPIELEDVKRVLGCTVIVLDI